MNWALCKGVAIENEENGNICSEMNEYRLSIMSEISIVWSAWMYYPVFVRYNGVVQEYSKPRSCQFEMA